MGKYEGHSRLVLRPSTTQEVGASQFCLGASEKLVAGARGSAEMSGAHSACNPHPWTP